MEAIVTGKPYQIGGNVLNTGHLIAAHGDYLPKFN